MLFGTGARLSGMFATHPPLVARIQALDPSFKEADFPRVDPHRRQPMSPPAERHAAFAGGGTTAFAGKAMAGSIAQTVGQPGVEHVEYAKSLRQSLPRSLYDAAHSSDLAYLLTIALVLDRGGKSVERQLSLAQEQLGTQRAQLLRRYYDELATLGAEYRLPLLEIAFPALKLRPSQELTYVIALIGRMIEVDDEVDLYEYCFYRILTSNLGHAGALDCTGSDFVTVNLSGFLAAAKFVNGPDDPESPGNEDSAFGTVVPEPGSGMLVGLGLAGIAWWRRTGTR